jgi:hypothetical protein
MCGPHQGCGTQDGGAACTCASTICAQAGTTCQSAQTLATCAIDGNGCVYIESTTTCPSPQSCSGAAPSASCSLTCTNSCVQGQTTCVSGGLATCAMGSNGCWAYGVPAPCPGVRQACTGTAGAAACTCTVDPVCTAVGAVCAAASTVANCAQDAQGCFYEASSTACSGNNSLCLNAACVPCMGTTNVPNARVGVCGTGQQCCGVLSQTGQGTSPNCTGGVSSQCVPAGNCQDQPPTECTAGDYTLRLCTASADCASDVQWHINDAGMEASVSRTYCCNFGVVDAGSPFWCTNKLGQLAATTCLP